MSVNNLKVFFEGSGRFRMGVVLATLAAVSMVHFALADSPISTTGVASTGVSTRAERLLSLLNDYRSQHGLQPLQFSSSLLETAQWMSQDMANNDYFSHTDSMSRDPFQRMDAFGYSYNVWRGENLAAASEDPAIILQYLEASPGHNENLLRPEFSAVGISVAFSSSSYYGWYWAMELGGYVESAPQPQESTTQTISLSSGWNSFPYQAVQRSVQDWLNAAPQEVLAIAAWDQASSEWKTYWRDLPAELNGLTVLEPYHVYWVYASGNVLLPVP